MIAEIVDSAGMASTRLAEAVGYPGSSVAFAQLLSGMERDGLITREVRGKRTYRIALSAPVPLRPGALSGALAGAAMAGGMRASGSEGAAALAEPVDTVPVAFPPGIDYRTIDYQGIDYDELARRVLVHLVHRLAELNPAELAALAQLLSPAPPPAVEQVS
jgi:hypothetical protein